MRTLIWLIGIFAAAVGVALLANANQGYALLVWPPYRVQVSLNFLLLAALLGFIGGYALVRLVLRTLALPGAVDALRRRRRRDKGGQALRDALQAVLEGRYSQAIKAASAAFSAGEGPGLAAITAARAAHAMRDDTRYRIWSGRAAEHDAEVRVARLMSEAELAVEGRRFAEAEEKLELLRSEGHRHIAMLRLSLRTAQARGRWDEVLRLARQLAKHKAMSADEVAPLLRRAHLERLRQLGGDAEALRNYWQNIPAAEREDRRLIERALPLLAAAGEGGLVRKTIEQLLDEEWDEGLARQYVLAGLAEPVAALGKGEAWLREHPRDAGLLFSLGRLCEAAQLWGKARSYLEVSLGIAPTVETHLALAQLLERLEQADQAQQHYRAAATLSAPR